MTPEQRVEWEAEVRSLYDGMVRIVVTPTWAKLIDFETTLPSAVEELVRAARRTPARLSTARLGAGTPERAAGPSPEESAAPVVENAAAAPSRERPTDKRCEATRRRRTIAKYLLLKHYRGAPAPTVDHGPMDQWTPEEVDAHVQYMRDFGDRLQEKGEFVDVQALTPGGHVRTLRRRGPATGHRRSVRGDQGPDRRLVSSTWSPGPRGRGGRRAVRRTRARRQADPRVARGPPVPTAPPAVTD